jgi:hypothetical protein
MSEYQYYEFRAIDRPLDRAAQKALRAVSSRATITATSFTNHYEWGDLKGDPNDFMERWFDLHLYVANWGSRRFMMRAPQRLLNSSDLDPFLHGIDWVEVWTSGDNVIVDIHREDREPDYYEDDGSAWLAALAPLRADLLAGDLRLFYLVWLTAVQDELVSDEEMEPLPGIGPLTEVLEEFADFIEVDSDLVQAAAERTASDQTISPEDLREAVAAIPEHEKVELLLRVVDGDAHVAPEIRNRLLKKDEPSAGRRTVGALRQRAREIRGARELAEVREQEAEQRRKDAEAEKARRARLVALKKRGAQVWREIEEEIERRNGSGYDRATSLLTDLQALAVEDGSQDDFARRIASIRARHEKKGRFIERLTKLGLDRKEGEFDPS